jgi:hypothetical protein
MSSKVPPTTYIGKFYKQIEDFKDKMVLILSQFGKNEEIIDLNKYYDKLLMYKKINVRQPIELFYTYGIETFVDQILTRDENFFLGKVSEIEHDPEHSGEDKTINPHDLFFISQVRQVWHDLQPNVKKNIWDYIQVICILAEKVVGGNIMTTRREFLKKDGRICDE